MLAKASFLSLFWSVLEKGFLGAKVAHTEVSDHTWHCDCGERVVPSCQLQKLFISSDATQLHAEKWPPGAVILCNVFISNSSYEWIIQLCSYNGIYSYNYTVLTVMSYLGEKGYRISGKHHKLGSLCGYPLLFPPVGLESFSSRHFECWEGRKNSLISPLLLGHFKTSLSSCTVSSFSSMAWVITHLTTPKATTNCVSRSLQQEGDFFLRAAEKFST